MKIINKIAFLLSLALFAASVTSCSEFMLIPISVDYPFEQGSEASPSTYKINITEGLQGIEKVFNSEVLLVTNTLFKELKIPDAEITTYPKFVTDDILDLIAGKTVHKEIEFQVPMVEELQHEGAQENEGKQRDDGKHDDLPGQVGSQTSGKGREARTDGKADRSKGGGANFTDNQHDGGDKPNEISLHIFKEVFAKISFLYFCRNKS